MQRWKEFLKSEVVLVVAVLLAIGSMFLVPPDAGYIDYIDFRTLSILFSLMAVMAGFQEMGVFREIAEKLLSKVSKIRQLVLILVLLCFFFSMLITNDVALITFVPFSFIVLGLLGEESEQKLLIPVVVLQTIAANLGSMLTPIGNPQNLYLYGKSGMSLDAFLWLLLPYSASSLLLLIVCCIYLGQKSEGNASAQAMEQFRTMTGQTHLQGGRLDILRYLILFGLSLLTVARVLPYVITLCVVIVVLFLFDRKLFSKIDYSLLITFVGFFIFIGNMGRIPAFCTFLQGIIEGNEVLTAVVSSQVISNVPAALLLSGFTTDYEALILGTNLGGLGTLIASMASLISYKYIVKENRCKKGAYFSSFTIANILFLVILMLLWMCIG